MSEFMKIALIILCFTGALQLKGQDTICKLSGECFVAKVRSQSKSKIRYSLLTDLNVRAQTLEKKELSYVRFKNGSLDVYQGNLQVRVDTNKIYKTPNGYIYKEREVSNGDMLILIKAYPYVTKRQEMLSLHKKLRRNNRNRRTHLIIGAAVIPFGALMILAQSSLGNGDLAGPIALMYLGTGSVFVGVSQFNNARYHRNKKKLVEMYNAF